MQPVGDSSRTDKQEARGLSGRAARALLVGSISFAWLFLIAGAALAGQTRVPLGFFCEGSPDGVGSLPCTPSFSSTYSLAVHQGTGDVFVLDTNAARVLRFKANGEPDPFSALGGNFIDGQGPGADQTPENGFTFAGFGQEAQIAVDSSGGPTDGNIYVTQKNAFGLHLIDIFDSTGEYRGQLTGTSEGLFGENSRPAGVAVDGDGTVFASDFKENKIYKYTPVGQPPVNADGALFSTAVNDPGRLAVGTGSSAGALFASTRFGPTYRLGSGGQKQCQVQSGETGSVAVDPGSGHVLVSDQKSGQTRISEYDAAKCDGDTPPQSIASFDGQRTDMAVAPGGRTYLTAGGHVEIYSPLVPLPDPITGEADPIGETKATLNGTVAANGEELTECRFEYGTTSAYGATLPCAESLAEIGTGTAKVHADISALSPETVYHFRLIAANVNGPAFPQGADRAFQTVGKPQILAIWSQDVGLSSAILEAQINPESAATAYRFEWGLTEAPYEHVTADASIGSQPTAHTVSLSIGGLQPGTAYHFRVSAENHCHPESSPGTLCSSTGGDRTFTTFVPFEGESGCANDAFRYGASASLPDCRAYEMVSPVDKNGGNIITELSTEGEPGGYVQSRPDGNAITYTSTAAFAGAPTNFRFNQYIAERRERGTSEEGWASRGINPPIVGQGIGAGTDIFGFFRYFHAFTPDLCSAWWIDYQTPPLTPEGQEGYANLYRRQNCGAGQGRFEALVPSPAYEVQPPTAPLGYVRKESVGGVSTDGTHTVFTARAKLTDEANESFKDDQLYDYSGGELHLVSVLPNGSAATGDSLVGGGPVGSEAGAVSADGSRVYWSKLQLYLREHPEQGMGPEECEGSNACTIQVSPDGTFWAANEDGSKAIYTQGETLFEFDLGRYEAEETASLPIAGGVKGVAGQSADLSRVYFVSTQVLPESGPNSEGDEAQAGQPNLYLHEAGAEPAFEFIATLAPGDAGAFEPETVGAAYNVVAQNPWERATRVSADGSRIAFNSRASLTGYDNASATNGKPAVEVFAYEAGGELSCASCNPSGGRPESREMLRAYEAPWEEKHVVSPSKVHAASWLPTWETSLHASNALSADGNRLFFNANDALLPRDANEAQDVYEWEAPGTGGCHKASPSYFAQNDGCLYLISGGESGYESQFWEAAADGGDVFFTTAASLLPQDPGLIDLYDARVGGGFAQPEQTAQCEGEACQNPPAPPEPGAPASSTYAGPPNPPSGGKGRCPKGKRKVRVGGKARCVKKHGKGGKRRRRGGANGRAGR